MNRHRMDRRTRALTLLPIAALSATWVAGLSSVPGDVAEAARTHSASASGERPGDAVIPAEPLTSTASMRVAGAVAPAVAAGAVDSVVASASAWGIPSPALAAYQRAAQVVDASDPTCHLRWEQLAAIGRVESDHGRFGGSVLSEDGVSMPAIYGPTLDGRHGTRRIADTDAGEIDGDPSGDRAVGALQFIPATWAAVKVDGDGDGVRNPQDIDDAALGAAVYLCSGDDDLATRAGQRAATYRYNHSARYVDLVLAVMDAYSTGLYTAVPSGTYGGTVLAPATHAGGGPPHGQQAPRPKTPPAPAAAAPPAATSSQPTRAAAGTPAPPKTATPVQAAVAGSVGTVTAIVPQVLTRTQATVACLGSGIPRLDLLALARCVTGLLAP